MKHQSLKYFLTLTQNSSVKKNVNQASGKYPRHQKQLQGHTSIHGMEIKLSKYFYQLMDKSLSHYFQVQSRYYLVAQFNQKTSIPLTSRRQVRSEKAKVVPVLISLSQSQLITIKSDSFLTNAIGKDGLQGLPQKVFLLLYCHQKVGQPVLKRHLHSMR